MKIVHLVSQERGGVHDYSVELNKCLRNLGQDSDVLTLARGSPIPTRDTAGTEIDAYIVHMSGYGFAKRGLCFWLIRALHQLKATNQSAIVYVIFHEVFATSLPHRSAFWTAVPQMLIARRLLKLADITVTNSIRNHIKLQVLVHGTPPIDIEPVFSNIPVHGKPFDWPDRGDVIAVFGGAASRRKSVAIAQVCLAKLRESSWQVIEVGSGEKTGPESPTWVFVGEQPPEVVSSIIAGAKLGIVSHNLSDLTKSGVFAALAAHGCVSVIAKQPTMKRSDVLVGVPGTDAVLTACEFDARRLPLWSKSLLSWYSLHTAVAQAERLLVRLSSAICA